MADGLVSLDVRLAVALSTRDVDVSAFCRDHGISRQTFYEMRRRFDAGGIEALVPRSRRPLTSPTKTSAAMGEAIVALRIELLAQGWDAGAVSIRSRLLRAGVDDVPSARTIHRILVASDQVEPQPSKRPRNSFRRFEMARANECWQMDGHDRKLADGTVVKVLRVQDDCSRQIMASRAAVSENVKDAWACLSTAIDRFGAPAMFLSDNGSAFSQRRKHGSLGEFEARLRLSGIMPITSSIGHPQTCGKKEREWQTLDRWLAARPLAASLPELQTQLDTYDQIFNHQRPHQAHGGKTPAERFNEADKAHAAAHALAAPMEITTSRVGRNGVIQLGHRDQMSIGTHWAGATVTILREHPAVTILHDNELIEFTHLEPGKTYHRRQRR